MVKRIRSGENEIIKLTASLGEKKNRDKRGLFVVEGRNFVNETANFFVISQSYFDRGEQTPNGKVYLVSDNLFKKISSTETPQGILAVCQKKALNLDEFLSQNIEKSIFLIGLDRINDPGNLGTLIRTADAFGVDGVVLSQNCADVYSPKTIRASAGAVLRTAVYVNVDLVNLIEKFRQKGVKSFAATPHGGNLSFALDFCAGCVIIIGNEANGIAANVVAACDGAVAVPMRGQAESLNAAVCGGVLMYEVMRQRKKRELGENI